MALIESLTAIVVSARETQSGENTRKTCIYKELVTHETESELGCSTSQPLVCVKVCSTVLAESKRVQFTTFNSVHHTLFH